MASRVANEIALKHDPQQPPPSICYASSNISGVIGSWVVAAGVLIALLGS
ncbi:MAG: hypothetical protein R2784_12560 [Saprospiraceae bacterium]